MITQTESYKHGVDRSAKDDKRVKISCKSHLHKTQEQTQHLLVSLLGRAELNWGSQSSFGEHHG